MPSKPQSVPEASLKIRIRCGEVFALGPGKADLLEAVEACHSIAGAGRQLGFSYWKTRHMLDEMNACFRAPVVETAKGGKDRGGAALTETGRRALEIFRAMESRARAAIREDCLALAALLRADPASGGKS